MWVGVWVWLWLWVGWPSRFQLECGTKINMLGIWQGHFNSQQHGQQQQAAGAAAAAGAKQ